MCVRLQNKHESTPIEMANTIAVPIATAVRVPLRLQNTHEDPPPVSSDAKYTEKARKTLLEQAMDGVEPTIKELNKLKQQYFRKDSNAWLKRQERAKKRRVRDKEDEAVVAGIVAELGARAGADNHSEQLSSPLPALLSPSVLSSPAPTSLSSLSSLTPSSLFGDRS